MRNNEEVVLFSEKKTNLMHKDHGHHHFGYIFDTLVIVGVAVIIYLQVRILKRR